MDAVRQFLNENILVVDTRNDPFLYTFHTALTDTDRRTIVDTIIELRAHAAAAEKWEAHHYLGEWLVRLDANKEAHIDELIIPGKVHIICACCKETTFPYARIGDGPLEGRWICKHCCEDSKPCCADL